MFKLIFRTINIIVIIIILIVGLALWKGGEPFRWLGEGMVTIGEKVSEVGDIVDEMLDGGSKMKKSYKELKEVMDSDEEE